MRIPTIGILAGWQYYWTATPLSYLNPIYRGVRQAAADLGCNLLMGCGMGESAASSDPLRPAWFTLSPEVDFVPIGPWNTDGILAVNPLHARTRAQECQEMIASGHPLIFIGSGQPGPTIVADNVTGIRVALRHLVGHGHRHIAFIAGSPEDMEGDTGARLRAYQSVLRELGLPVNNHIVAYGRHVTAGGYAAMQQILQTGSLFSAVLASNDESALGAMQALHEAGLSVPQDVAVIGFDDRRESAVQEPALTTVSVPLFEMGYRGVEHLLRQIQGKPPAAEPVQVATRLVIRASCGCKTYSREGSTDIQPHKPNPRSGNQVLPPSAQSSLAAAGETEALSQQLIEAFWASVEQENPDALRLALDRVFRQVAHDWDDADIWQAAFSVIRDDLPTLVERWPQADRRHTAHKLLDEVWETFAAGTWRRHRQHVVNQRWVFDRIGQLTAHLLTALDEDQVYAVLAQHLPAMGIQMAAVALFTPDDDDPVAWGQMRLLTPPGRETIRFPCRQFPPQGFLPADRPFSLALLPLSSPRGILGFVVFDTGQLDLYGAIVQQLAAALNTAQLYREATEGRRLAEEANQMKSRFLSTVSHELRTPLNLIVGLGEILLQDSQIGVVSLPDSAQKDIERLHANAQHLGRLISDVLDLASSDAGQLRLNNQFVDLAQTFRSVAETGRRLAGEKGLTWQTNLPESGPWVWGDRTRLAQVVLNLISNAIKFTARGQVSLTLTVDAAAHSVMVCVSDTGIGIPPAEQSSIFEDFHRSERSITRGYSGLGLGLAICRRLINLHGGSIGVGSTGQEDAGATFFFTLPTVKPPAEQESALHVPLPASSGVDVLVLAATQQASDRLCHHLQQSGYNVEMGVFAQSTHWQSQLLRMHPRAIVLDMSTAADLAWSVLHTLKSDPATQEIPIFFYAQSADSHDHGTVLEIDFLTKPIALTHLTRALDQHWLPADTDTGQTSRRAFLVVDDDLETLEMHARIVQAQSPFHRVFKAASGREALSILQREPIGLVLLDLMMPEMDGFAVLEAMRDRESTRSVPVIVVTGQSLTAVEMERLQTGVTRVLSKGVFRLDEMLTHLDAVLTRKRQLSGDAQRLVRQAMAYMHEHYTEPITRQEIAGHVALSEDYLTSCFRKELGLTPVAYLHRYRVEQARQLLKNSQKSITEIAVEVGFASSSYFSRIFHRETGMTPADYRKNRM